MKVLLDEVPNLAAPLAHQRDHVDVGGDVSKHHAEERALAHAAAREDAHALSLAAGQQRVDRPDANEEFLVDPGAGERVTGQVLHGVVAVAVDGARVVNGVSEAIDHTADKAVSDGDFQHVPGGFNHAAADHAVQVAKGHQKHPVPLETDGLRVRPGGLLRAVYAANRADVHHRPGAFNYHADDLVDLAVALDGLHPFNGLTAAVKYQAPTPPTKRTCGD